MQYTLILTEKTEGGIQVTIPSLPACTVEAATRDDGWCVDAQQRHGFRLVFLWCLVGSIGCVVFDASARAAKCT